MVFYYGCFKLGVMQQFLKQIIAGIKKMDTTQQCATKLLAAEKRSYLTDR